MADITKQDVVDFIEKMTVLELSELVKELEEKLSPLKRRQNLMSFLNPLVLTKSMLLRQYAL